MNNPSSLDSPQSSSPVWLDAPSSSPPVWLDAPSSSPPPFKLSQLLSRLTSYLCIAILLAGCEAPALPPASTASNTPTSAASSQQSAWHLQLAALRAGQSDTLRVEGRAITASELAELEQFDGPLEQLLIEAGGVDDLAMRHIAAIHSLVHLRLRECDITDAGLEVLIAGDLPHLRIVNIPQAHITARGIESLSALPSLVQLRLGGRQLNDAAVRAIARLPGLRSLHLIAPELTDKALIELSASPRLSSFYLDDCPLSDSAWEALFAAKPQLHVHIDQQHHDRDPHRHEE